MARGALAFAWVSSVAVHAVAALVVTHAVRPRAPVPPARHVYLAPLGPGTGEGGAPGPVAATPPTAPAPRPVPRVAKPRAVVPKPRPAPRDVPAAPTDAPAGTPPAAAAPTDAPAGTPPAAAAPHGGDGSGSGAGGGSPTGSPLGSPAIPPAVLTRVPPVYPPGARESGVEGAVVLLAIVAEDGRIETPVRVARSIPALDGAAIAALERWRFRPGRDASGRAIRAQVEVPIRFELR
jgi:protein TonB